MNILIKVDMIFHCTSRRNTGPVVIMVQHQSTLVFTHVTEELCMLHADQK